MQHPASIRPRVLLACTAESADTLRRALAGLDAEITCTFSKEEAMARIARGVDLVVCSLRFDESRMLDFVAQIARERPRLPMVCCKAMDSDLPGTSLDAAFTAAGELGAVAVINLPEIARRRGADLAERCLREAVASRLHGAARASMS